MIKKLNLYKRERNLLLNKIISNQKAINKKSNINKKQRKQSMWKKKQQIEDNDHFKRMTNY